MRKCSEDTTQQHQALPQQDLDIAQECPKACSCTQIPNRVHRSADEVVTFTAIRPSIVEFLEPSLKVVCVGVGLTNVPFGLPDNTKEL